MLMNLLDMLVNYVKNQLYDYPTINRNYQKTIKDQPLDIVFIDNGEKYADMNYITLTNSILMFGQNTIPVVGYHQIILHMLIGLQSVLSKIKIRGKSEN